MTTRFPLLRAFATIALLATTTIAAHAGGDNDDNGTASEPVSCGTQIVSTIDPAVALANTARLHPQAYQKMISAKSGQSTSLLKTTSVNIGDEQTFNVLNSATSSYDQITATLQFSGKYVRIWLDQQSTNVTPAVILQLAKALDSATVSASRNPKQGIIQNDVDVFGPVPVNQWQGDHMTEFLLTDIQDNIAGANILGFFYPVDQSSSDPASNNMNILYIDSKEGLQGGVTSLLSTVAHEFQHLLHYARNKYSETMYNEGCSEDASILNGYMDRGNSQFMSNTNVDLFRWSNGSALVTADYERAMTFMHYLQEQFGEQFLNQFVGETSTGMTRIDRTLTKIGSGATHESALEGFAVANLLRSNANLVYSYELPIKSGGTPKIQKSFVLPNYPADTAYSLSKLASMYVGYNNTSKLAQGVKLTVSGSSTFSTLAVLYKGMQIEVRRLGGAGTYTVGNDQVYDKIVFVLVNTANSTQSLRISSVQVALGVDRNAEAIAAGISLTTMPNPVIGSAVIKFTTGESGPVTLKIFNSRGQEVSSLIDGDRFEAGEHEVMFDAGDLSNGYYVARLTAGTKTMTQPLVLLK